ncbi:MAG: GTP cyclohydrolase I FolE [bacterium]|nr:GTP cyclohydrolase I FolE [bacterium]
MLPPANLIDVQNATADLLRALGCDPTSPHFENTPKRVAKLYDKILDGNFADPPKATAFETVPTHDGRHQWVEVHNAPIYSFCAHHLLPFHGKLSAAYLPDCSLLGLSKIIKLVRHCAKVPTVQEELTQNAANLLLTSSKGFAAVVLIEAEHMCMTLRGAKSAGALTVTQSVSHRYEHASTAALHHLHAYLEQFQARARAHNR